MGKKKTLSLRSDDSITYTILILYFSEGGALAALREDTRLEIFMITCTHTGNFTSVQESRENWNK